jgi:hypothetical protein
MVVPLAVAREPRCHVQENIAAARPLNDCPTEQPSLRHTVRVDKDQRHRVLDDCSSLAYLLARQGRGWMFRLWLAKGV